MAKRKQYSIWDNKGTAEFLINKGINPLEYDEKATRQFYGLLTAYKGHEELTAKISLPKCPSCGKPLALCIDKIQERYYLQEGSNGIIGRCFDCCLDIPINVIFR